MSLVCISDSISFNSLQFEESKWETEMRFTLLAALLIASTTGFTAGPEMDDLRSLIKAQQEQIELLQRQLDATRTTLEALSQKVEDNTLASEEANQKAEILAENIESQPAVSESATSISGYGELHANMLENQATGEDNNKIDFHRFVLFFDHRFNDRLRFASELEIEHTLSGDSQPGEVELEQAYIEYDWADAHSTIRSDPGLMEWETLDDEAAGALNSESWTNRSPVAAAITWERLLLDLHAARFLGPMAQIFNDLMAGLILVLALSGIWLWRFKRKQNWNEPSISLCATSI
jgi:hypothetical protein